MYGLGATWTDQQWLAQVFMYGVYSLGGFALLSIATATFVVAAFSIAAAAARQLGAGARAIWVMFLPVLVAAPWAWSIRAQMLALPALHRPPLAPRVARRATRRRRIWLALPLLVVWANVHGSVALGALLVMLLGAYELSAAAERPGCAASRSSLLAPLAVLATPYGPVDDGALLPPAPRRSTVRRARHRVAWADPAVNTMFFYALAAIAIVLVWLGRRRLTLFDIAVLALTFAGGVSAIRGIVWFALACMVFVPVAIGHKLESKNPGEPRRGLNIAIADRAHRRAPRRRRLALLRKTSRGSRSTGHARRSRPFARSSQPDDRVFAPDRFSDWMLFKIPELRGRIAYDVRFELYDDDVLRSPAGLRLRGRRRTGSRSRTATASSSSTRRRKSHTADFLAEPGTRVIYRDDEITIVARPRPSQPARAAKHEHAARARTPSSTPDPARGARERRAPARAVR